MGLPRHTCGRGQTALWGQLSPPVVGWVWTQVSRPLWVLLPSEPNFWLEATEKHILIIYECVERSYAWQEIQFLPRKGILIHVFPPWLWDAPGLPDLDCTCVPHRPHICFSKCNWIYVTEGHNKRYMKIRHSVSGYSQSGLPCCPHWRRRHGEKLPQGLRTVSEKKATPVTLWRGCLPDFPTVSLLATTFSIFPLWQQGGLKCPPQGGGWGFHWVSCGGRVEEFY